MPPPIEQLEPRRLLALVTVGDEQPVPMIRQAAVLSDVAVVDDGGYLVAAAGQGRIALNRYTSEGRLLPGPIEFFGYHFDLDVDPDGDAVLAWFGSINSKTGGLFFRTISKNGAVSDPTIVFRYGVDAGEADSPAVSMDDAGNFFISYRWSNLAESDDSVVRTAAYDAAGHPRSPVFEASRIADTPFVTDLHIAAYPDGSGAAIVYDIQNSVTQDKHAEVVRVSTSARVGNVRSLPAESRDPSVDMTGPRSFVVGYTLWKDYNDFSRNFVKAFVQRFDNNGAPTGSPALLGASLPSGGVGIKKVSLAGDTGGGFVANFLQDGTTHAIYAARHTADGAENGIVSVSTGGTDDPAVAAGPNGRVVATYHRNSVVYAQRLGAAAEPEPSTPYVLTLVGNSLDSAIRVAREGDSIAVYRNLELSETHDASLIVGLYINGLGGNDTIINETDLPSTILGGEGFDFLTGGSNRDSILGEFESDVINGGAGNDILRGDDGDDSISGNAGNDILISRDTFKDLLYGDGGDDSGYIDDGDDEILSSVETLL